MTLTDDLEWERTCANSSAHPQVRAQLLDDALGHALTALNETERALNEHSGLADLTGWLETVLNSGGAHA